VLWVVRLVGCWVVVVGRGLVVGCGCVGFGCVGFGCVGFG